MLTMCACSNFHNTVGGSTPVQLTESEIQGLCLKSREMFLRQPVLLDLKASLKVVGEACMCWDLHTGTFTVGRSSPR